MADTDAVRGTGLPERLPSPSPSNPGTPVAGPETVMTLVDHLTELRSRIVRSIAAIVVGTVVGFVAADRIKEILTAPLPASAVPLQFLSPGDGFSIQVRIAVVVGVILAMPVLLYQLWAFISPGLTPTERRALRPWIPLALFFFVLGVTIAYAILPYAIGFLLAFSGGVIVARLAATPYFDFVTTMFLAFGLLMEFPIVLYALARVGILSSARLTASRRYIFLGILVFSTIATPGGDLVSPTILATTMFILFEITLRAIRRSGR
jgi:sec-independent protein translocase protein TatC